MDPIATQMYEIVERVVTGLEKKEYKRVESMHLYQDRIVTAKYDFPLHEILDISYRKMGDQGGLLYLHTNSGLYSYLVASSPMEFIRVYRGYG
ncbi:hypothetical protein WMZ97_11215 [Lentibacillus sp. N15]|uniref:hypothetical protein n=1 Tax=Lentibacillus songyuanensis TaxID=3136161 RepID=UPI0031BA357F